MALGIRLGGAYIDYSARTAGFEAGARAVRTELKRQQGAFRRFRNQVRATGRQLARFGAQFGSLGGVIGTGLVAGGLALAITSIATLGDRLAAVQAISGATASEFSALRAQTLQLGRTTRFSATEAAEGHVFLARAGLSVAEAMHTLPPALRLAQVGMVSIGEASDLATNAMAAFREGADQAGRFADVLAEATSSSNTDLRQLGDGLKLVAPAAVSLGLDLETTVAALGKLADAGLQATLGGTGLRQVLFKLAAPTDEASRILEGLGLNTEKLSFRVNGLAGVLENLARAGITAEQAIEVFGARGQPAFSNLVANIPALRELEGQLRASAGAAARMATILDDTLRGAALRAKSAGDGFVHEFGRVSGATDGLRDALEAIAAGINSVTDNLEANFERVRHAAVLLLGVFVASRFTPVLGAMVRLTRQVGLVAGALAAARTAAIALGTVLRGLARIAGLFLLVEGVLVLIDAWEGISRAISRVSSDWRNWAVLGIDAVQRVIETIASLPLFITQVVVEAGALIVDFAGRIPAAIRAGLSGESIADVLFEGWDERLAAAWAGLGAAANTVQLPDIAGRIFGQDVADQAREVYAKAGSEAAVAFMNSIQRRIDMLRGQGAGITMPSVGLPDGPLGAIPLGPVSPDVVPPTVSTDIEFANRGGGRGNEFISEYHLSLMGRGIRAAQELAGELSNAQLAGQEFGAGLGQVFANVLSGARSLKDALRALVTQIAGAYFQRAISTVISPYLPGLQHGGPVEAHRPYVVGEAGPELFVPQAAGNVVSNADLNSRGAFSGQAGGLSITYAPVIQVADEAGVRRALAASFPLFRDQVLADVGREAGRPSSLRDRIRY